MPERPPSPMARLARWLPPALVAAVAVLALACGGETDGIIVPSPGSSTPTPAAPSDGPPTPSPTPRATPLAEGYRLVEAFPSARFDRMVGFAPIPGAPNEAAVITQYDGEVWRITLDESAPPQLMGDLSGRLIRGPASEEGLLGVAFSPDFPSDGRVYLYYTAGDGCPDGFDRCGKLSRFRVRDGALDMDGEEVLLTVGQPHDNHNGGALVFGPDGYLYLGLGDGGAQGDPQGNGQDLSTLLGSVLRLDVSGPGGYTVPPDNPFVDTPGARPEIFAYGLRNPWRITFDRASGDLWAADVGQDRWEEVERIVAGGNYGWNIMEGFECFQAQDCDRSGLLAPRAAYGHSLGCSVTGGYVYRGPSMLELNGWYVYGDFCSGLVWAVDTAGEGEPILLVDSGLPISSFGELPDGELVAVTFANQIFRLARE